jgi:hypothetical protein
MRGFPDVTSKFMDIGSVVFVVGSALCSQDSGCDFASVPQFEPTPGGGFVWPPIDQQIQAHEDPIALCDERVGGRGLRGRSLCEW